jgi:hypothetical protein
LVSELFCAISLMQVISLGQVGGDDLTGYAGLHNWGGTEKASTPWPSAWLALQTAMASAAATVSPTIRVASRRAHAQPFLENIQMNLLELFVNMMALVAQEGIGFFAAGAGERQR